MIAKKYLNSRNNSGAVMQPQPVPSPERCRGQKQEKAAGKPEKPNQRLRLPPSVFNDSSKIF